MIHNRWFVLCNSHILQGLCHYRHLSERWEAPPCPTACYPATNLLFKYNLSARAVNTLHLIVGHIHPSAVAPGLAVSPPYPPISLGSPEPHGIRWALGAVTQGTAAPPGRPDATPAFAISGPAEGSGGAEERQPPWEPRFPFPSPRGGERGGWASPWPCSPRPPPGPGLPSADLAARRPGRGGPVASCVPPLASACVGRGVGHIPAFQPVALGWFSPHGCLRLPGRLACCTALQLPWSFRTHGLLPARCPAPRVHFPPLDGGGCCSNWAVPSSATCPALALARALPWTPSPGRAPRPPRPHVPIPAVHGGTPVLCPPRDTGLVPVLCWPRPSCRASRGGPPGAPGGEATPGLRVQAYPAGRGLRTLSRRCVGGPLRGRPSARCSSDAPAPSSWPARRARPRPRPRPASQAVLGARIFMYPREND